MHDMCKENGIEVYNSEVRIENRADVEAELDKIKPSHALFAAGITGRPNIDWCEDHKADTIRTNVIGTLNVADLCCLRGIHTTIYATGCIFKVRHYTNHYVTYKEKRVDLSESPYTRAMTTIPPGMPHFLNLQ